MRTISHHRPTNAPKNDTRSRCDYCGVTFYRSQLRRDRAGMLACERDFGGDVVTLSEANALDAQRYPGVRPVRDPGPDEQQDPPEPPPPKPWPDGVPPIS